MICKSCRVQDHKYCVNKWDGIEAIYTDERNKGCFCQHKDELGRASRGETVRPDCSSEESSSAVRANV